MADQKPRITHEQKIGLVLLSAFVLLAVTLGLIQMRNTLYKPFALNKSIPPLLGEQVNTPDALRYRDTDFDGLTDFDELYIYTTSPYLADSDSDGIKDKDEINSGKNPNCAEGKDCSASIVTEGSALPETPTQQELFNYSFPDNIEDLLKQPENIRMLLLEAGLSQDVISKLSDEDLAKMATDIFASSTLMQGITVATNTPNVTGTTQFINQIMTGNETQ